MLTSLGLSPSFGFGDRLGLATPGHIQALRAIQSTEHAILPVFAQQSVRENARTGRTPQQVLDDARRAVEAAGWDGPWGADADHLKTPEDLPPFVQAGYTFYTVDPSAYVDNDADTDPLPVLREKARNLNWDEVAALYLGQGDEDWGMLDEENLLRALVKYGRAIRHAMEMYRRLCDMLPDQFDFEVSVDETSAPTTPPEHFFIASELTRAGVRFTSLALRFPGRWEKGVDYIGDLAALEAAMAKHAAVAARFGTYKISLHSGSDKFSVYPLLVRHFRGRFHVKTAGTSYLEALRTLATTSPALLERIWALALERYGTDRLSYHVSADPARVPSDLPLQALLDHFHARQILHVTFGSVLAAFGSQIREELARHAEAYAARLRDHFRRHLELLLQAPADSSPLPA
ncbi:MAG: tagaturonate epimerase family protein [Anaerolineae bacterium]|nr:tagaturonate epimerase family protein [Anaerolineae bacterium]MCX8068288.1 tagaturonate epimerase family protein [Anaerolineae bacterium]MDW7992037.1 tagaturonate epimerase family protein [Anaerolineae bacterium]